MDEEDMEEGVIVDEEGDAIVVIEAVIEDMEEDVIGDDMTVVVEDVVIEAVTKKGKRTEASKASTG